MEVPDRVVPPLEPVGVASVVAKLEDEGSLAALEDIVIWIELISVVNATADDVCEELGGDVEMLDSAGLCTIVTGGKAEKPANKVLVEKDKKIDWEK